MTKDNRTLDKNIDQDQEKEVEYGKCRVEISEKDSNHSIRKLLISNKELRGEILRLQDESFLSSKVAEKIYEVVKQIVPKLTRKMLLILSQEKLQLKAINKNINFTNVIVEELARNIQTL